MAYALERSHIFSVQIDAVLPVATPLSQEVLLSPLPTDAPEMAGILTSVTKD